MVEQRRLNVFFDVDYTLIMADGRLRNHTEDVFSRLKDAGHGLYIWSGVGIRRFDMRLHNLDGYVDDYFIKPLYRYRERLAEMDVTVVPDYVVDDHSQVVAAFDAGYHIPDIARKGDRELLNVLEEIEALARVSTHIPLFRKRPCHRQYRRHVHRTWRHCCCRSTYLPWSNTGFPCPWGTAHRCPSGCFWPSH